MGNQSGRKSGARAAAPIPSPESQGTKLPAKKVESPAVHGSVSCPGGPPAVDRGRKGNDVIKEKNKGGDAKFVDFYDLGEQLGEGSFGIVYSCGPKGKPKTLAVKMVDKVETPVHEIQNEAEMMKKMDHPNVMKCHDIIFEKCFVCIVMDRLRGGDLITNMMKHWKTKGRIDFKATARITFMMATAMDYLHSRSIIHRDVKADNFLCDGDDVSLPSLRIVITDFGTAQEVPPNTRFSAKVGTKLYWSPQFYENNYAFEVDIWACGVVSFGLIHARFPFKNEAEVKKKIIKIDKEAPIELATLVMQMLEKDEAKRIKASQMVQDPYLQLHRPEPAIEEKLAGEAADPGESEKGCLWPPSSEQVQPASSVPLPERERGAGPDIHDRREELVERMFGGPNKVSDREQDTSMNRRASKQVVDFNPYHYRKNFKIVDIKKKGAIVDYEWWPQQKAENLEKKQDQSEDAAGLESAAAMQAHLVAASKANIARLLKEHGIDADAFGVGDAKTLDQLAAEVVSGQASLMLDASDHKKLVRVLDVVALRICASDTSSTYLVESQEKFPDGRTRTTNRLPGTKKDPSENTRQAVERIMKIIQLGASDVEFNMGDAEEYESEEMSKTYPGVITVYRKTIIEGVITDEKVIEKKLQHEDSTGNVKYFEWMTEEECVSKGIEYKSTTSQKEISALVAAPLGFHSDDDLETYLVEHKVDVSKFGSDNTKTLSELADELRLGDAHLVLGDDGSVLRVVDVILLKLINSTTGEVLVQTQETLSDGRKTTLDRLPGTKGRPNENQFTSARRILAKHLQIPDDLVTFVPGEVKAMQQEQHSLAYPGLRSIYRKRIFAAYLADSDNVQPGGTSEASQWPSTVKAFAASVLCVRCSKSIGIELSGT